MGWTGREARNNAGADDAEGMKIQIKPLTVNQAWQGRRFKTEKYKAYDQELLLKLRPLCVPEGPLSVVYIFGVSSPLFDWDNAVKPFQDVLQKKYGFDDRRIIKAVVEKILVKKGEEFIDFIISAVG